MQITNITSEEQLNSFVGAQKHSQFLQSWQWGEFDKIVSGSIFRIGVQDGENLVGAATVVKKILPIGKSYFYCPRGPIVDCNIEDVKCKQVVDLLFNKIKELAQEEGVMFLRFDPIFQISSRNTMRDQISKTLDIQPSKTLIMDLSKPESELLESMHSKTRYNIKLAEKKGVWIVEDDDSRIGDFWQLMGETSDRDSFRTHGINYYKEMVKLDGNFVKLFFAEYKGKAIGSAITSSFGDMATYMHGASCDEDRNVMAPYAMQWHCIKLFKEQGFKYYDLYGIDEEKWPGVTRFKKGFGGEEINYPGTFDLPFDQGWYSIYKMVRKVRRTF
ncbi:MAG: peptidoglycan bridge formation glycyltransferase FemA/FemB family protein [Candidatus Falkowbacteria bacterium]